MRIEEPKSSVSMTGAASSTDTHLPQCALVAWRDLDWSTYIMTYTRRSCGPDKTASCTVVPDCGDLAGKKLAVSHLLQNQSHNRNETLVNVPTKDNASDFAVMCSLPIEGVLQS